MLRLLLLVATLVLAISAQYLSEPEEYSDEVPELYKRAPMRFGKRGWRNYHPVDSYNEGPDSLQMYKRAPMRFGKRAPMRFGKRSDDPFFHQE